jgi:hypothetical protein
MGMMEPDRMLVRAADGRRLEFRRHVLSSVAESRSRPYLAWEPWTPDDPPAPSWELIEEPDGFSYSAPDGLRIAAVGFRGIERISSRLLGSEGKAAWSDFPGCNALDLAPLDKTEAVRGEIVRLRRPARLAPHAFLLRRGPRGFVIVEPAPGAAQPMGVELWVLHKIQNHHWEIEHKLGALPLVGGQYPIPTFQGAFAAVVRTPRGFRTVASAFFASDDLIAKPLEWDAKFVENFIPPADDWEGYHASLAWPDAARLRLQAVSNAFRSTFPALVSTGSFDRICRAQVRCLLLADTGILKVFNTWLQDSRPDEELENLISARHRDLPGWMTALSDPYERDFALHNFANPELGAAIDWAAGHKNALPRCLRWSARRRRAGELEVLIAPHQAGGPELAAAIAALDALPAARSEEAVAAAWAALDRALLAAYGAGTETISASVIPSGYMPRV